MLWDLRKVIIGAAFGKIVSSLVADIIMPPLGLLIGGSTLNNLFYVTRSAGRYSGGRYALRRVYPERISDFW